MSLTFALTQAVAGQLVAVAVRNFGPWAPAARCGRCHGPVRPDEERPMFGWLRRREETLDPEQAVAELLYRAEERARQTRLEREALYTVLEDQRAAQSAVLYEAARRTVATDEAAALALIKQAALSKIAAHAAREARYLLAAPSEDELELGARLLGSLGSAPAIGGRITRALTAKTTRDDPPESADREPEDDGRCDTTPLPRRGPAGGHRQAR